MPFDQGYFGDLELEAGTFRPIKRDLDPGSLVAIPLADRIELAMVLHTIESFVVAVDENGRLRALHRTSAVSMPVALRPRTGQRVWVPFVSDLSPARVKERTTGLIRAATDDFPDNTKWYGDGCYIDRDISLGLYEKL